jgi:hypothetical protein
MTTQNAPPARARQTGARHGQFGFRMAKSGHRRYMVGMKTPRDFITRRELLQKLALLTGMPLVP